MRLLTINIVLGNLNDTMGAPSLPVFVKLMLRELLSKRHVREKVSLEMKDLGSVDVKSIHEPLNKAIPPGRHTKFGRYIA